MIDQEMKRMIRHAVELVARLHMPQITAAIAAIESEIVMADFKRNSSYFMRKHNHPLIVKREGIPAITWPKHALRSHHAQLIKVGE